MKKTQNSIVLAAVLLSQLFGTVSYAESAAVIDDGTTLTSKGFTFYSAQDFNADTLKDYVTIYKNGEKVDGITITKLNKKKFSQSGMNVSEIPVNIPYRVNLPEQITESGDVYTLEIEKDLAAGMEENYSKSMMLDVLMYDNFDNYTGTVTTGKDSTGKLVRESTGTEENTWLGNAWIFENSGNVNYDTHAVMSIDNGRLKFDYKNEEDALGDDVRYNNNGRIMSAAYAKHTEWKDYTVEYDLTPLETKSKYVGGIYPRANATGNKFAPLFYRSGFDLFSEKSWDYCYIAIKAGSEIVPKINEASHVEATATKSSGENLGSYSLIVDDDYYCKVTNAVAAGEKDFVEATGTPRFGAMSDQDFCIDNLVVSKAVEVAVFGADNTESYPSGNKIVLNTSRPIDSDSLDASDFSVYIGSGETKESINVLNAELTDEKTVTLTLEKNLKNKTTYTVEVAGELESNGSKIVFRSITLTTESKAIDVESITSDGNTYTAMLKNYRAGENTVFATLAAYDKNNKLVAVNGGSYILNTDTPEENRTITITANEAVYVKCYILNGLDNINTVSEERFETK